MPCGYRINPKMQEELGFLPLIAAAPAVLGTAGKMAGGIVKGIGSLFGGKKKKKAAPPPPPAAATKSASAPDSSRGSASKTLAGMPGGASKADVKVEALAALKTYQQEGKASQQNQQDLVKKLAAIVKPTVDKMHADVKQAALHRQVTSEHKRKMRDEERWKNNELAHQQIMAKFDALEKSLVGSHDTTKRVFKIYGVNA